MGEANTADRDFALGANAELSPDVLERALHATDIMIVLTDPHREDNPIIWVNDYFCVFTGYDRDDVIGRNCRFLQGDERDQPAIANMRASVSAGEPTHVLLRNFKADGTLFYNNLYVSPVRDHTDPGNFQPRYFIGVQNDSTQLVRAQEQVAERAREVEETAENERERFGMDLHDGLGQELAGARLLARVLANQLAADASPQADAAARIVDLLGGALQSARDMARGLNPVDASAHGLGDALCDLAAATSGSDLAVLARVEPVTFSDRRQARHLYRIAQEAVSNALCHADATEVVLTLHRAPDALHLEICDDGVGISQEVLAAEGAGLRSAHSRAALAERGMGLYGMRHRADLIGATFSVTRRETGGTAVRCVLPVDELECAGQRGRSAEQE